jgi:hypothetical protein
MTSFALPLNIAGAGIGTVFAANAVAEGKSTKATGWSLVAAGNIACIGSNFVRGNGSAYLAIGGMLAAAAGVGLTFVDN